jgi:cell division protein FtsB
MQNAQVFNLEPSPPRISDDTQSASVENEFHSDDVIEQTRSEVRGVRTLVHQQQDDHDRRMRIFAVVLGFLILALLATVWFAYPTLRDQKSGMAEIAGLKNTNGGLNKRIDSVEANVNKMAGGLPVLVDQFQKNMKAEVQVARDQAAQVEHRVMGNVNQSIQSIQRRLSGVESTQKEANEHVNQLQNQIAQLNHELATVREQASASRTEIQRLKDQQETSSHDMTALNERTTTSQTAITNLTNRVDRNRVEFQIFNRQKTAAVTPEIDLTVKHIDLGKQEVDLALQLGGKNGDLSIRGQGIRKPVLFYMPDGTRRVELVLTQITKESIAGYLLMPLQPKTAE